MIYQKKRKHLQPMNLACGLVDGSTTRPCLQGRNINLQDQFMDQRTNAKKKKKGEYVRQETMEFVRVNMQNLGNSINEMGGLEIRGE